MPLIADYRPERAFAWRNGRAISCGRALAGIQALAARLAPGSAYINCCEDRHEFTVALAAISLAGGVNLLPQSRSAGALADVRDAYPDARLIDDGHVAAGPADSALRSPAASPTLAGSQQVATVFTSGSTGRPSAHGKCWRDLSVASDLYRRRFFADGTHMNTVATVPPQHMYGLETSVFPALHIGFAAHTGRPFTPWAVAAALADIPPPRVLITTPVHLRACVQAGTAMPPIERVISATAPLAVDLARAAETRWQTEVDEIYGSTETGSIASRGTGETDVWTLYDGMSLAASDGFWISGAQLPAPLRLSDELELQDARHFRLLGRTADMLKLAGKRLSIGALNQHLLAIEGVADAAAFIPPGGRDDQRPAALVVAPGTSEREIAARLARVVDPVFVPRPLLRVARLPRNTLGKLPQSDLNAAFAEARREARQHKARP